MEKDIRITARVTEKERQKVASLAEKCGLSQSEYIKQRALGYEPSTVSLNAFFHFCEKMDLLIDRNISPEVNKSALDLLSQMSKQLLSPRKEGTVWQQQDSGPSEGA